MTKATDPLTRFMRYVNVGTEAECWTWQGYTDRAGYGRFHLDREHQAHLAHRAAYFLLRGPIPDGLDLDHLCGNPACVNPGHLEPVTRGENTRRGGVKGSRSLTCGHGHLWSEHAVIWSGRRYCLACQHARGRASYRRKKSKAVN